MTRANATSRHRNAIGNVIPFPRADVLRLERAIEAFDRGDQSYELYDDFAALADGGVTEANFFLGCMHEDGLNSVAKDVTRALQLYERTVEEFGYVEGYLAVARLLYYGHEVPPDHQRAFRYYSRVAEHNGHIVATFMLGRMYHRGEGTEKNLVLARAWYEKALALGSVHAMLNLAMLEAQEGKPLKSLWWRCKAGVRAFRIARRNPRDIRLRPG